MAENPLPVPRSPRPRPQLPWARRDEDTERMPAVPQAEPPEEETRIIDVPEQTLIAPMQGPPQPVKKKRFSWIPGRS